MTNSVSTTPDATPGPLSADLSKPELYLNCEWSALEFNFRVLAQARASSIPLLERLRFLCISVRNLDEFFEVRVASLKHWIAYGDARPGPNGMPLSEVLAQVRENAIRLVHAQYETWNDELRLVKVSSSGTACSGRLHKCTGRVNIFSAPVSFVRRQHMRITLITEIWLPQVNAVARTVSTVALRRRWSPMPGDAPPHSAQYWPLQKLDA